MVIVLCVSVSVYATRMCARAYTHTHTCTQVHARTEHGYMYYYCTCRGTELHPGEVKFQISWNEESTEGMMMKGVEA